MKRRVQFRMIVGLGLLAVGCGGSSDGAADGAVGSENADDGGSEEGAVPDEWPTLPTNAITEASALEVEAALAASTGCLNDTVETLGGPGTAAGRTSSGDTVALWVSRESGDTRVAAVEVCTGDDCSCATVTFSADGAAVEGGASLPVLGAPVLGKKLTGQGLDAPTELATATGALDAAPTNLDPALFRGKRRFVVANAYGPAFGVSFDKIVADASATDRFTEAREHAYVQAPDVDRYLNEMHGGEVLVWFGAAVQRGVGGAKPEGMTVNRGVYGDQHYDRERVEAQITSAPLGGPGLLVLAGAESFGTAEAGLPTGGVATVVSAASARPRAVVGFRGFVEPRAAIRAVRFLLDALYDGQSLTEAMAAGNAELEALGSEATLATQLSADEADTFRLDPAWDSLWPDGPPDTADFVLNFLPGNSTQCTPVKGGTPYVPNNKRAQFFTEVSVDGPFFEGSVSKDNKDFTVFGVVAGLSQGGRVQFFLEGSSDFVSDIVILGDARFCAIGECAGKVTPPVVFGSSGEKLYFTGSAETTSFIWGEAPNVGDTCVTVGSKLVGTGDDPSWLVFGP